MKSKQDNWDFKINDATDEHWWVCTSVEGIVRGASQKRFKNKEDCEQNARIYGYPENYKAPIGSEEYWNE